MLGHSGEESGHRGRPVRNGWAPPMVHMRPCVTPPTTPRIGFGALGACAADKKRSTANSHP